MGRAGDVKMWKQKFKKKGKQKKWRKKFSGEKKREVICAHSFDM